MRRDGHIRKWKRFDVKQQSWSGIDGAPCSPGHRAVSPAAGLSISSHSCAPCLPLQAGNYTFNRAKLMNVGFKEAMREDDWDCLFFHDVDLIPEDDRNLYVCDANPKHAAIAMDKFGYKYAAKAPTSGSAALSTGALTLCFCSSSPPGFPTRCTLEASLLCRRCTT